MTIKTIYWDFSGVLFIPVPGMGYEERSKEMGISHEKLHSFFEGDMNRRVDLGEITHEEFYSHILKESSLSDSLLPVFMQNLLKAFELNTALINFIHSLPATIQHAVLSNYSDRLRFILEEHLHIADIFADLIISSEVQMLKPDEEIYQTALARFCIAPSESIFVDDRIENVEGAKRVGMHGILFNDTQQVINDVNQLLTVNP